MDSRMAFRLSTSLIAIGLPLAVIGFFLEAYRIEMTGAVFYAGVVLAVIGSVIAYLYTKDYFKDPEPKMCQTSGTQDIGSDTEPSGKEAEEQKSEAED